MFDWFPTGTQSRRTFIALVILGCVSLGLVRFLLVPPIFGTETPDFGDVVDETLGNIIATALAATVLAWLLLKIFPPPARPAVVVNVPAHEIRKLLESSLPTAKRWLFDGSTGRYQRATTLPEMGRLARADGTSREVTLLILDPTDDALCTRYANYRRGLASGEGRDWTVESVRRDLYATILAACTYNETEPLTVTVAVKSNMSILRYDFSDSRLVITKEGKTDPAICCPAESFYFDAYLEDLRWSIKQSRHMDLSLVAVPANGFSCESARGAFQALDIYTSTLNNDEFVTAVINEARSRDHPYS
jgi:hypothetical protein